MLLLGTPPNWGNVGKIGQLSKNCKLMYYRVLPAWVLPVCVLRCALVSSVLSVSISLCESVSSACINSSLRTSSLHCCTHIIISSSLLLALIRVRYCKTYFRCILISWLWNVEILLHFNLAFSQCYTSIYQAFDGKTEFSRVFNFTAKIWCTQKMCFTVL